MKHTPGPWEVFEHYDHSGLAVGPPYQDEYLKGHVKDVCTIRGNSFHPDYQRSCMVTDTERANAYLIAAAPELYEALDAMLKRAIDVHSLAPLWGAEIEQARKAIAKAEGEKP